MFASYVTALSSLNIAANVGEEDRVFLNFSLDILDALGFGLNSLRCERCGEALGDDVFFSTADNAFHCLHCASTGRDILISPELATFLQNRQGSIDEHHVLIGIALALRLLRSAASKLATIQAFEGFAKNAATLFRTNMIENNEESQHEL